MYKSCRHNALRADMLVRPYGWFANIHGASGYGCAVTILFQQHNVTPIYFDIFNFFYYNDKCLGRLNCT